LGIFLQLKCGHCFVKGESIQRGEKNLHLKTHHLNNVRFSDEPLDFFVLLLFSEYDSSLLSELEANAAASVHEIENQM